MTAAAWRSNGQRPPADSGSSQVHAGASPQDKATSMLALATWAGQAFARYDAASVSRIVSAVAGAAAAHAQQFAEQAVAETGMGVAEHKVIKNMACSTGLLERYSGCDYVSPRIVAADKIVEVPCPAGVVLALTPSTNPVATVYFKTMLCLLTRNAVVISPHPMAKRVCAEAAAVLAAAAEEAGAPRGVIQCVTEPTIPLIDALMTDERIQVILATGGGGVVRSAYSSGNPAIGVGPGNVPVFVDDSADIEQAAQHLVDSKAFDNSVLCTNESVLIVHEKVAAPLQRAMQRVGAEFLSEADTDRLRQFMYPFGTLNTAVVGKSASWIAAEAGIRVSRQCRVLVAPIATVVDEEPLTHEKLSPVLGMVTVSSNERGVAAASAVIRIAGAGHSGAVHSKNPDTIMRFAANVAVLRVSVNVGNSTGSSGLDTSLSPTMTIGTGYAGRSSLGENLRPDHLINLTRIAYNNDPSVAMPDFSKISPWTTPPSAVPAYPVASNAGSSALAVSKLPAGAAQAESRAIEDTADIRAQIRQLLVEELGDLLRT
jgi:acyl-CoA reductase-like NAD-dependent aldehyde dehydrogenase